MLGIFINLIVGVILSVASTLAKQAFARKPQAQQRETGLRGSAQFGGKVPQYFLIGTVGDPGKFEYGNEWGQSGGAPNAYSVDVYSFGDLPITGITVLFIGGVAVPLSTSGHVLQGYPATGDKAGLFWAEFLNGNQTSASTYLTSKFASDPDRPWLSDMIGVGLPYLITTALWADDRWAGQITGTLMASCQGIKLYDPRKDSTAGGSGTQRWDDQSTWAFSDNSMVIIYNIERGIYYDGAHVWGGKKTAAEMPYEAWAAAMDACDQSIALAGGGTEKQFRGGRRIAFNERPGDVIREFLIGCNGRIVHCADGTVWPLVGVPEEADGAFTDADVLATEPLGSIPFPNLDEIINGATATYREPAQAWEDKETAPYLRADLEEEDDGRQQIEGLDLGTTFSGTQAQRILKAVIEEGRRFRRHVVALPPEFAQFRPLQVLAWTSERFGYEAKLFLITARTIEPFGNVIFGLQEIDPADHDWNPETDEQPLSFAPVVTNRPAPQEVSGFYVEPAIAYDSSGNPRRPAIDVFWASASVTVDVRAVRITVRLEADESLVWEGEAPVPLSGSARLTEALLSNEAYEVQIQYQPHSGRPTVASSWLPVTTPDVPDADVTDIQVAQLGKELQAAHGLVVGTDVTDIPGRLAELQAHAEQLALAVMDFNATAKETLNILSVQNEGAVAAVIRNEKAIVEESRARAEALTEVLAQVGDVIAGGFLKFDAEVDALASKVQITAKAKATSGSSFSEGAWVVGAEADGLGGTNSYFGVYADTFGVFNAIDGTLFPVFTAVAGQVRIVNARIRDLTASNIAANSITADKLNVTTLSALSANLGTVTAGTVSLGGGKLLIDGPNVRIVVSD